MVGKNENKFSKLETEFRRKYPCLPDSLIKVRARERLKREKLGAKSKSCKKPKPNIAGEQQPVYEYHFKMSDKSADSSVISCSSTGTANSERSTSIIHDSMMTSSMSDKPCICGRQVALLSALKEEKVIDLCNSSDEEDYEIIVIADRNQQKPVSSNPNIVSCSTVSVEPNIVSSSTTSASQNVVSSNIVSTKATNVNIVSTSTTMTNPSITNSNVVSTNSTNLNIVSFSTTLNSNIASSSTAVNSNIVSTKATNSNNIFSSTVINSNTTKPTNPNVNFVIADNNPKSRSPNCSKKNLWTYCSETLEEILNESLFSKEPHGELFEKTGDFLDEIDENCFSSSVFKKPVRYKKRLAKNMPAKIVEKVRHTSPSRIEFFTWCIEELKRLPFSLKDAERQLFVQLLIDLPDDEVEDHIFTYVSESRQSRGFIRRFFERKMNEPKVAPPVVAVNADNAKKPGIFYLFFTPEDDDDNESESVDNTKAFHPNANFMLKLFDD